MVGWKCLQQGKNICGMTSYSIWPELQITNESYLRNNIIGSLFNFFFRYRMYINFFTQRIVRKKKLSTLKIATLRLLIKRQFAALKRKKIPCCDNRKYAAMQRILSRRALLNDSQIIKPLRRNISLPWNVNHRTP